MESCIIITGYFILDVILSIVLVIVITSWTTNHCTIKLMGTILTVTYTPTLSTRSKNKTKSILFHVRLEKDVFYIGFAYILIICLAFWKWTYETHFSNKFHKARSRSKVYNIWERQHLENPNQLRRSLTTGAETLLLV